MTQRTFLNGSADTMKTGIFVLGLLVCVSSYLAADQHRSPVRASSAQLISAKNRSKESNVRKGFFEHVEYLALRWELPNYLKPVLTFGYYTGAHEGEILGLKWHQVDLKARTVNLEPGTTKNDQPRTIPLTGELLETLKMQKAIRDLNFPECEYMFSWAGKEIGSFHGSWKSACKRAAITGKLFHDLRRTAVRNMGCSRARGDGYLWSQDTPKPALSLLN